MGKRKRRLTLSDKQQKLIAGIAAGKTKEQAAIDAGYAPRFASRQAYAQIEKSHVREALAKLTEKLARPTIATATERQEFWTGVMRSRAQEMQHRLKAAEYLGKAQGDFNGDGSGNNGIGELVALIREVRSAIERRRIGPSSEPLAVAGESDSAQ